ncbi:MAG: carbohydrate ABC transporter permease [Haloplanus sp.]
MSTRSRFAVDFDDPAELFRAALKYGFGFVVTVWMLFPIFWLVTTSIKSQNDLMRRVPKFVYFHFTFSHYAELFGPQNFGHYLLNSLIVAVAAVSIGIVLGVPAAYALSRMDIPRESDVSFWILSTRMIPPLAVLVPLYIFYTTVGLTSSLLGLIITHLLITLPMIIWIVKGFIDELPRSLEESALVDGCNRIQAFREIVVPLVAPGIAAAAFIGFIFSWNNFLLAIVLTSGATKTAPLVIQSSMGYLSIDWGLLGAAGTITILPPIVVSLLIRDYLVEGITMGAVKE